MYGDPKKYSHLPFFIRKALWELGDLMADLATEPLTIAERRKRSTLLYNLEERLYEPTLWCYLRQHAVQNPSCDVDGDPYDIRDTTTLTKLSPVVQETFAFVKEICDHDFRGL